MQFFCGKNQGAISVFLTLILVPVLIFSGIIVDASRLYASKTVISGAGELTMNAALSRYDAELKDAYGLIAMADRPDSPEIEEELSQYFLESCNASYVEGVDQTDLHSMIQLEPGEKGIDLQGVEYSALSNPEVLQQQILEYMKFRGPVYMVVDILEKFQKLPLDNMGEKKEYVEAKSDYGKKASELGVPMKKAKEYVERHSQAAQNIYASTNGGVFSDMVEAYREKSVFWLAARSLENYLDKTTMAPIGSGTISMETLRDNLAGSVEWSESNTQFSDSVYADLIAAISLYQSKASLEPEMTEENGFTRDEIDAFHNIEATARRSIANMDKIHEKAAKEYKDTLKVYEDNADTIIDSGKDAVKQLEKMIDLWESKVKKAKENYEQKRQILEGKGEDLSGLETDEENIEINVDEVRHLITALENNVQSAEAFKSQLKTLKKLPDQLRSQYVSGEEGRLILEQGGANAVQIYWNSHSSSLGISGGISFQYQEVLQENFYKEWLKRIQEGKENPEQKQQKKDNEKKADESQDQYQDILAQMESAANEKNLEDYEGLSYPSEFPSGLSHVFSDITSSKKVEKIDVSGDDVSTVTDAESSLDGIEELLTGLDNISGALLERAYLMEYMSEMFNCLTTEEGAVSLAGKALDEHYISNGEMEYILYGNQSTLVNKLNAVGVLFALRLAIDSIYVFFDKTLNAEASGIAAGVAAVPGMQWSYPIVKYGYLFCRAVIMSCSDIAGLTQGKDVAVWPADKKITLNYKEYMKLFLLISMMSDEGERKLVSRVGDCIQLNTGERLSEKYTMVMLEADVLSSTTFLPRVPVFLGRSEEEDDGKKLLRYKSVLAY